MVNAALIFNHALHAEPAALPISQAVHQAGLNCKLTGDGREELTLDVANKSNAASRVEIPAGMICKASNGDRVVVLRTTDLDVTSGGTSDARIPAAALSSKNPVASAAFEPAADKEPKLAPLLDYLATRNDVPRATSQLIALVLLEDVNFAQWQQFLAPQRTGDSASQPHPSPAEIVQAIDALGVLRSIAPDKTFALASDAELKLRALRSPVCRAKAMQLFGMTIPGDAPPGAVPPDLGQLLHTKPGDNCPICRMRAQMQGPQNDL